MKPQAKSLLLLFAFIVALSGISNAQSTIQKSPISVLYVGYDPGRPMPEFNGRFPNSASSERYPQIYEDRMSAFASLLNKYFENVSTLDVRDYTPELSESYDVTIFDAVPKELAPEVREYNESGQLVKYERARYLPEGFDQAVIFIASTAPTMGDRLGLKLDWLCLCLDAHAVNIRKEHPIFNKPFDVDLTMKMRTTPKNFFLFANGQSLGEKMPMWRVQTEGYKDGNGYMVGLVSRGGSFEDSPDAEYIAGGINTKDVGAVALGRHGNFFLWGFSGSPKYMTEEAKKVFVNTIYYMSRFEGRTPIVYKWNERITTRDQVDDMIFYATREAYQRFTKYRKAAHKSRKETIKSLTEKKEAGKELSGIEKAILNAGVSEWRAPAFKEYLAGFFPEHLVKQFGTNTQAYQSYYEENRGYFYAEGTNYNLILDEQAKNLGIPNNSLRLLDKCIELLEKGKNVSLASDVLERYTTKDFTGANQWRNWYEQNKGKLFFTEAGGYKFMVDTWAQSSVSGAYTDNHNSANEFDSPVKKTLNKLECAAPVPSDPVAIAADIAYRSESSPVAVVLKARILKNWHIYSYVSEANPYIETELTLQTPDGIEQVEDWEKPKSVSIPGASGVFAYEGDIHFIHKLQGQAIAENRTVKVSITYQACDPNMCLPPVTKEVVIQI